MKIKIDEIVDEKGDKIVAASPVIDLPGIYAEGRCLWHAAQICTDMNIKRKLLQLYSSIRIAYFLKVLQDGGTLAPIIVRGKELVDGGHRLRAHMLFGSKEIDYIAGREGFRGKDYE